MKVGDKVRYKSEYAERALAGRKGSVHTIRAEKNGPDGRQFFLFDPEKGEPSKGSVYRYKGKTYYWVAREEHLELVEENNNKNMSIVTEFRLIKKPEPERSFIESGVMNQDGSLTPEGNQVFTEFMMNKYKQEFYKEVVRPIMQEKVSK